MSKRRTDKDFEEMSMAKPAADSSTNDAPVTGGRRRKRLSTKRTLVAVGICLIVAAGGSMELAYRISEIDTRSVTIVLSEDRMDKEALARLQFTSWREPPGSIRPFVHGPKSFEGCEILRYRKGSGHHWLFRHTYYEAQYRMADGSTVIGPAFGPRPYTAPNILVFVPLVFGAVSVLGAGIAIRVDKTTKIEAC